MKYLTLKSKYALRGWSNIQYAILDLECMTVEGKIIELTKFQFDIIELITAGGVLLDEKIFSKKIYKMIQKVVDMGFLEECDKNKKLEDYQKYHYSRARYTHTLLWSITGNCNLNCKHCYISAGENMYGEPTMEKCDEVIRQCKEANVNMVALTGGEPLVRKDFWQIVERLNENYIKILQLFTNGMNVNEKFMDEFERHGITPNCFIVSFDGVGCHDWLRGRNGAEKQVIKAIQLIKSRGYKVTVSTSIHMGNRNSLIKTYELMKELNVENWQVASIVETGNWKNQTTKDIDIDSIYIQYLELLRKYRHDGMPMKLGLGGLFQGEKGGGYSIPFVRGCGTCERKKETLCEAVNFFPYLLPDGRVLPCITMSGSAMENIAPNIFEEGQSLEKALSDSNVNQYIQYTYSDLFENNSECKECEHCFRCTGCRARALTNGGYYAKDLLACRFIKGGYEQRVIEIMSENS